MRRTVCILVAFLTLSAGCGTAISDSRNFALNNAPAVAITSVTNPDGSAIDLSRIVSYVDYTVTVTASDPDGDPLSYSFRTDSGSFSPPLHTASGCSVTFRTGALAGGQKVGFSVGVSDSRGGAASASYDVGAGKLGPMISVSADRTSMKPESDVKLTVRSNCSGTFIAYPNRDGAIASAAQAVAAFAADGSSPRLPYPAANSDKLLAVAGPTSSTAAKLKLTAQEDASASYDRTYAVWVVFADALGQTDAVPVSIRVDDVSPHITASDPAMNAVSVATERNYKIMFSEDMDPASFTADSLSIEPVSSSSAASGTVRFDSYANRVASFHVSGLSRNTEYSASVSAKDLVGNEISSSGNTFTYTTTPTYALTYDINQDTDPDGYHVTGSAPVDGSAYAEGEEATVLGNTTGLSRDSHLFKGWNTSSDGSGGMYSAGSRLVFGSSDITLYAKWEKKPYRVAYNLNGSNSEAITDRHFYSAGETVTVSAALPERQGYSFKGWSTAANGSAQYRASNTFVLSGNTTLYAVWQANLITSITLSPTSIQSYVGFNPVSLTASLGGDPLNSALSWTSNNAGVAAVTYTSSASSTCTVTVVGAGSATITAAAQDGSGKTASCTVTVGQYYEITASNAGTLNSVMSANQGGHFKLCNGVSLGVWTPIPEFSGEFEGNNLGVDLIINNPSAGNQALFAVNRGTIRNLSIAGTVSAGSYSGMLAAENRGTIENCSSSGTVKGQSDTGGLVGANNGIIRRCSSSCTVTYLADNLSATQIGGLVGNNWTGTIERSYATGVVNGGSGYSVGGLVGYNNSAAVIKNCYATGKVTGWYSTSPSSGTGGLVGTSGGRIEYCYAAGLVSYVSTQASFFGGILGHKSDENSSVDCCYYDEGTTKCTDMGKGSGETSSNMKDSAAYEYFYLYWNFSTMWNPPSGGYPTLQ